MKLELLDANFKRHACAQCDSCGQQRTLDVCEKKGWLLSDSKDLCDRCKPPPPRKRP